MLRVSLLQFAPRFGEVTENLDRVAEMIAGLETDVLVLPELFSSGYWFSSAAEVDAVAEDLEGPTLARVRAWALELDCAVAAGFCERHGEDRFNSAILTDGRSDLVHYRKLHLFAEEKRWFRAGDLPLRCGQYRDASLGLMVCFDWRYPETARTLAFAGADLILHPSNLVLPWCPDAMVTRALENGVFIATADRCGDDHRDGQSLHFIGQSQVVAPDGTRLGRLGETETGILQVEIDAAVARNKAVNPYNDLFGDLRPEFYRDTP